MRGTQRKSGQKGTGSPGAWTGSKDSKGRSGQGFGARLHSFAANQHASTWQTPAPLRANELPHRFTEDRSGPSGVAGALEFGASGQQVSWSGAGPLPSGVQSLVQGLWDGDGLLQLPGLPAASWALWITANLKWNRGGRSEPCLETRQRPGTFGAGFDQVSRHHMASHI